MFESHRRRERQKPAADGRALMLRLFERIEHEARRRRAAHPPANDLAHLGVNHEGEIYQALQGDHVGEIRYPQRIRARTSDAIRLVVRHVMAPSLPRVGAAETTEAIHFES